ncbi:Cysteine desulfurase [Dissulfuribacter thermophilus]|uniref:cysteine desulfurase n=1 Tax=Dissulfuribacter thermophilus TaxID=1156395 RepID=A0A1B9F7E0_9BACT|nr:cysteine desulfurase family protein [Dissulfuribacter thermophilus]OCC15836.1 Cysteine desulfurase [Dissulfuribacter thermophilus]
MERIVYMDHASATSLSPEVKEAMMPYLDEVFWNPSVVYDLGSRVKDAIEDAREKVADLINAEPDEIVFTSSGAEANNLAIKGIAFANPKKGKRIIVSAIEHHSVLNSARFFERLGYEVTFLPVDRYGLVDPERLKKAISPDTVLVSIMHANNEIGTIEPIKELCEIAHENGSFFHTDAVATVGNIPVDVKELGIDLLSLSGISLGAPKGTGALYFKKNTRLMPLIHGGIQERGRRAGTENVPGIIGLGKAAELRVKNLEERAKKLTSLRDRLIQGVTSSIPKVHFTGHPEKRLPNHASFCIEGIEGEALIFMLSANNVYANTGSACASKALKTSPVLVAIGLSDVVAQGSVVFTLDESNSPEDVDHVLNVLPQVARRLREMSPVWKEAA